MPNLQPYTMRRLAAYHNYSRDGIDLTTNMNLTQAACWSWALTGVLTGVTSALSANSMIDAIVKVNIAVEPPVATGINDLRARYPGSAADFNTLNNHVRPAINGNAASQNAFKIAMVRIMARQNGLTPNNNPNSPYTLHLKTQNWYSWDHWGLGVLMPDGRRMFIQTITDVPVAICCDRMWDEGFPETVVGLNSLLAAHVNFLKSVPRAPVRNAHCVVCNTTHGYFSSRWRHWHSCRVCGSVYCHTHAAALGGAMVGRDSKKCSQAGCPGRTEVVK